MGPESTRWRAGDGRTFVVRRAMNHVALKRTMPVTTVEKVTALSRDFGSQRRLAELLDVSPAQVTRWRRGQGIDDVNAGRVDLLELVMAHLLRLYPMEAAERWLIGANPSLGERRPVDPHPPRPGT